MILQQNPANAEWIQSVEHAIDDDYYYSFENIRTDLCAIVLRILTEGKKLQAFTVELSDTFFLINDKMFGNSEVIEFIKSQNLQVSMISGISNSVVNFCGFFVKDLTKETLQLINLIYPNRMLASVRCDKLMYDLGLSKTYLKQRQKLKQAKNNGTVSYFK